MLVKTSIILRFVEDNFVENLQPTIGVDYKNRMLNIEGKKVKFSALGYCRPGKIQNFNDYRL